tara:strand:- start:168 stop:545 length:378 start_codon:yes stop_codon:yes gene_type:complete
VETTLALHQQEWFLTLEALLPLNRKIYLCNFCAVSVETMDSIHVPCTLEYRPFQTRCRDANIKARFNDCKMHHNRFDGLVVYDHAVVDLHGTKTDIHSNKRNNIHAYSRAKVNIHLPSFPTQYDP